ncbi:MAG: DUF4296 domain-containing protein [Flavobacterium sp.]|nr:DUF4296 domain-containing protein [Flavobacterium sp.]
MKRFLLFFAAAILASACNNSVIEKPDNLISKDKMVDVIYDMALLQAMKLDNPVFLEQHNLTPATYIYKKYKIDSVQFAQNDRYYASMLTTYKEIYQKVNDRLEKNEKKTDSLLKLKPETEKIIAKKTDTVKKDDVKLDKEKLRKVKRAMFQSKIPSEK